MLQPVMISSVSVSSAAPTLKPEKSATACWRAPRAAATSLRVEASARASEPGNDPLEQRDELSLYLLRRLHHFRMMERFRKHARRGVGNARDAQHFEPHVARDDCFRRGRHPDRVSAERPERANFRGRLVA